MRSGWEELSALFQVVELRTFIEERGHINEATGSPWGRGRENSVVRTT
jgi:hypothetical protein